MVISQYRSRRSSTGSLYRDFRKKKQYESGTEPTLTGIGATSRKVLRVMGGNKKANLMQAEFVNAFDKKTKKCIKAKIMTVKANPANPNYIRRNIITKGCTVGTDKGDVRVTSRPGQDGTVNGYLI